jgi:hypothetical protein
VRGARPQEKHYYWLKFGDIEGQTGSVRVTVEDQAINTNYFKGKNFERRN